MKEKLVSFETAKLAKDKGFNCNCDYKFLRGESKIDGIHNPFFTEPLEDIIEHPTQSLLQDWLEEKHNLYLQPT